MISKRQAEWVLFSEKVREHIANTELGHYHHHKIQPLDFFEQYFSADALCFAISKYAARYPRTKNPIDLMKAADFVARLWVVYHTPNK